MEIFLYTYIYVSNEEKKIGKREEKHVMTAKDRIFNTMWESVIVINIDTSQRLYYLKTNSFQAKGNLNTHPLIMYEEQHERFEFVYSTAL